VDLPVSERRRSSFDVPDQTDAPVVWDPQSRSFVPVATAPAAEAAPARTRAERQWVVGADAVGKEPPPRLGTPPPVAAREAGRTAAYVAAGAPPAPPGPPRVAVPAGAPGPAPLPQPQPAARTRGRRRKRVRFIPRARWLIAFFLVVPLVLGLLGWIYANRTFSRIERVPVASVLDPVAGGGTNYLIVGSDSRDAVTAAGGTDPNVQPAGEGVGNQRSDTMIVLRVDGTGTHLLSLPRDLCLDPCRGASSRLNAAFNDGPASLIQAIRSALGIPINRYMEVDFVTFSSLVDALGGVTLTLQHGAIDEHSGLFIDELVKGQPFQATLDGETALAYVRSRHYEDIIDGERVPERVPFPDVARGLRQQQFLQAVFSKLSDARNPFTVARSASAVADGLRIDDGWSLTDAIAFAWHMRGNPPVSVDLTDALTPDTVSGASILLLNDNAGPILDQFR
jgi:LCP family protein required for cell wall assembly